MHSTVAVLGAGKLGEALVSGMLRAGKPTEEVLVTARRPERQEQLRQRYQVPVVDNAEAAKQADTVILAVKPQDMITLATELSPVIPADRLVISAAAGITLADLEQHLPAGMAVLRVMTNTPVLVDEGMSVISPGVHAAEEHLSRAERIFQSVGRSVRVPEGQQDAATALAGSGPAYLYHVVDAITEAGVLTGLPRDTAHELIVQAAVGASTLLRDSDDHPAKLREAITSPAGTTVSALRELEMHGVRAAFISAIEAARDRSRELAGGPDAP